jgi:hypothetical protein
LRLHGRLLGWFVLAAVLAGPSSAEDACAPWPGEFSPLPRTDDADPLRARWARLRADQLAALALEQEQDDRVEANRLWQRVLCLDPGSGAAQAGRERTHPQVVVQPAPHPAAESERATPTPPRAKRAPAPGKPSLDVAALDRSLARAEQRIRAARFEEALGDLRAVRRRLAAGGNARELRARQVRLEVLTATAQVAYGDETAARASLERALRADPRLELDPRSTPPKLRRALEQARGPREGASREVDPRAQPTRVAAEERE